MPTIAEKVAAVHRAVEALAQKKAVIHKDRMQCKRGCHACCIDGLTVFEVEAERILAEFANVDLGLPSSSGCVFLRDPTYVELRGFRFVGLTTRGPNPSSSEIFVSSISKGLLLRTLIPSLAGRSGMSNPFYRLCNWSILASFVGCRCETYLAKYLEINS